MEEKNVIEKIGIILLIIVNIVAIGATFVSISKSIKNTLSQGENVSVESSSEESEDEETEVGDTGEDIEEETNDDYSEEESFDEDENKTEISLGISEILRIILIVIGLNLLIISMLIFIKL